MLVRPQDRDRAVLYRCQLFVGWAACRYRSAGPPVSSRPVWPASEGIAGVVPGFGTLNARAPIAPEHRPLQAAPSSVRTLVGLRCGSLFPDPLLLRVTAEALSALVRAVWCGPALCRTRPPKAGIAGAVPCNGSIGAVASRAPRKPAWKLRACAQPVPLHCTPRFLHPARVTMRGIPPPFTPPLSTRAHCAFGNG